MPKEKKTPMRRCVGCMESKPKNELLRMVISDGSIVIDATGKANGRGIYLCPELECFDKAKKKKSLSRGLGIEKVDAEWYDDLRTEFEKQITGLNREVAN